MGILLIGAGAKVAKEELEYLNDLDFLVITTKNRSYQREIGQRGKIRVDISYIPLALLYTGLEEKWPWLLSALVHNKILFKRGDGLDEVIKKGVRVYSLGPRALEDMEIRYLRFSLYQSYLDLMQRRGDSLNSLFLAQNLFKEALVAYFKLNKRWVPKDKKILESISGADPKLFQLSESFLETQDMNQKIFILKNILNHILEPFGGVLQHWKKGEFPLK